MADSIEAIRADYMAELKAVWPQIDAWWRALLAKDRQAALVRWPTGPGGHPRFLAIFRAYYIRIDRLNQELAARYAESPVRRPEEMWGVDDQGSATAQYRPVDQLLFMPERQVPYMKELLDGVCFLPVAMDPDDRVV